MGESRDCLWERRGRAEVYPRLLGWVAFSHGRPRFLLQLTCVRVGDVCNKGKVRGAKLCPAGL